MNKILLIALVATVLAMLVCALISTVNSTHKKNKKSYGRGGTHPYQTWASRFMIGVQEALVLPANLWRQFKYRTLVWGANIAEGVHERSKTFLTDAAITTRFLLYKKGSDATHIAVSGASDIPIGTVDDEASAAEENVAVQLLGKGPSKRMVASEAIGCGVIVYAAASGKVATTGTIVVGVSVSAAAANNDVLEVLDVPVSATAVGTSTSAGIGYATGAGGAVTQTTDRTTGVTVNTICGAITTDTTSLAAGAEATFTVTNNKVAVGDVVIVSLRSGATAGTSIPVVSAVAAGSFDIRLTNLHASTADTGASIINFAVIKAVSA